MSLVNKQLGTLANQAIAGFLQDGDLPAVQSVIAGVYGLLNGRAPGSPLTNYKSIPYGTLANQSVLNALSRTINQDITLLYNENIDLVNRIVRDYDYKDTRRARITQRILDISSSLNQAQNNSASTYTGKIDSYSNIDFHNTSAFVDLVNYVTELPPATNTSVKADLSTSTINWSTDATSSITVGSVINITSDLQNQPFFVRSITSSATASMTITLQLAAPFSCTKLTVTTLSSAPLTASPQINGVKLPTAPISYTNNAEWEFNLQTVSSISITFSKSQPDSLSNGLNEFDFGIANISIYSQDYLPNGTFTTSPIRFSKPIQTLTLTADQYVPPNCGIAWNYSFNGTYFQPLALGVQEVINQPETLDYKRVYPVTSTIALANVYNLNSNNIITGAADLGLSVLSSVRGSRTPLFQLCRVQNATENITVTRGKNAWRVVSYHYDTTSSGVTQNPNPTINDITNPRGNTNTIYSRYMPTEYDINNQFPGLSAQQTNALRLPAIEYPLNSTNDEVMNLFEANITVNPTLAPSVLAIYNQLSVALPSLFANGKAAIYCNNQILTVSSTTNGDALTYNVILPLNPGQNLIQIVTNNYSSLGGAPFSFATTTFQNAVANGEITWWADSGPMSQTDLFTLQYQTSRNDFSRFAIVDDTTSDQLVILVRELPTTCYEVQTTGVVTGENSIILQANLTGSPVQKSLTPKINSYTVSVGI